MPLLYANDSTPLQLVVDIQEPDFELMASDHAGHHVRVFRFGSDHKEKFALCLIRFGD